MDNFDYEEALAELERIAVKAEDPSTGLEDIDKYLKRSRELIASCRAYLRTARGKADMLDEI